MNTYKPVTPSDALRYLMHTQRHELAKLKGGDPQGKCIDCRRQLFRDGYVKGFEAAVKLTESKPSEVLFNKPS